MTEITGIVKVLKKDGTAVLITIPETNEEVWFDLGPKVKPEYIRQNTKCFCDVVDGEEGRNSIINYIQCIGAGTKSYPSKNYSSELKTKPFQGSTPSFSPKKISDEERVEMRRMSAIKASSQIFSGSGKELDFKRLTEEIEDYIEKGIWINAGTTNTN